MYSWGCPLRRPQALYIAEGDLKNRATKRNIIAWRPCIVLFRIGEISGGRTLGAKFERTTCFEI
jgi:hypothetical protein